jgi:hypothetical protein
MGAMNPWTPAEQARHRGDLLAALDAYDRPRSGRPRTSSRPQVSDRQQRNLRHMGLTAETDQHPAVCVACLAGTHGPDCEAGSCVCRCRAMLGLDGPFPGGDPTAPDIGDQWVA